MTLRVLSLLIGLLSASVVLWGCGTQGVEPVPAEQFEIITAHSIEDAVVQWDPNEEPDLRLVISPGFTAVREAEIIWRQDGLQVAQGEWEGTMMVLNIDTPGCGYGGYIFEVTANMPAPDPSSASITVFMAPYLCDGSPWLTQ